MTHDSTSGHLREVQANGSEWPSSAELTRRMQAEVDGMWNTTFPPWRWPAWVRHFRRWRRLHRQLKAGTGA